MIDELHVRDIALIRDAYLQPACGMTALTGETGAGKTALLAACRLLMGERADRTFVAQGADEATVEGRFVLLSEEAKGDSASPSQREGEATREVVVARSVSSEGRSRVKIDGSLASVTELADTVGPSIDLCGQHDQQMLLKASSHAQLLDSWSGSLDLLAAYTDAFDAHMQAERELARIQEGSAASEAQLEEARFVLRRIDEVSPQAGEYEELVASLRKSENAEAVAGACDAACDALADDRGVLDLVNEARSALEAASKYDEALGEYAQTLSEASFILEDVARDARSHRATVEFDAASLEEMQQRAAAYQGLMRAYGPSIEDVMKRADEARKRIELVDDAQELEEKAKRRVEETQHALQQAASELADGRKAAAPKLAQAVTSQMRRLAMGSARLEVRVQDLPQERWNSSGPTSVELLFCPAEGMQPRPLSRIASGGELSRVMLAIHVEQACGMGCEADAGSAPEGRAGAACGDVASMPYPQTLVFDEIDAGVGGQTALALGEVLSELARTRQVIVVTHLAQVAARADKHYLVEKSEQDGLASTSIREVKTEEREEEIARMLSGMHTEASLSHARELLS